MSDRDFRKGDLVQHFKRELTPDNADAYLYRILALATHSETGEKLVVYEALYPPYNVYARPYAMFMAEVDKEKYPEVKQKYRFVKIRE